MEKYLELAFKLHDQLLESEEYKKLKKAEEIMLKDPISSKLVEDYKKALEEYGNNKSQTLLEKLHKAKYEMDVNELVIEYKKALKEYQVLVGNITDIVFEDFKSDSLVDCIRKIK